MTKITYLLGAGASYHAIPIVNELKERMEFHIQFLPIQYSRISSRNELDRYVESLKKIIPHLPHYTSIDTYAKYLKLKGSIKEYNNLKNALTMFFLLEQFTDLVWAPDKEEVNRQEAEGNPFLSEINYDINSKSFKWFKLDPRYNNFVVSLMDEPEWPSNVKILSWNYDFQLQLASNSINPGLLKYYPGNEIYDDVGLFHLNGIAGICGENSLISNFDKIDSNDFNSIISIWTDLESGRGLNQYLKYAWESDLKWELVENHLSETEILVVIGYSFPFFNRSVDSKIFELMNSNRKLRKIYFQNKDLDGQFLHNQFRLPKKPNKMISLQASLEFGYNIEIEQIKELDRFFIPHEF